jgi:hypothetical protein
LTKAAAAATLCEDQKLKISHIIVLLKIFLFKIKQSLKKVVWTDGNKNCTSL